MSRHIAVFALILTGGCSGDTLHINAQTFADQHRCNRVSRCGELLELSCRPETDGPVAYFNNGNGEVVMRCGGACDVASGSEDDPTLCTACPPPEWLACRESKPVRD